MISTACVVIALCCLLFVSNSSADTILATTLGTLVDSEDVSSSELTADSSCLSDVEFSLSNHPNRIGGCTDPINCYLQSLQFPIQDVCVDDKVCLTDMVCTDMKLYSFPSAYIPPLTLTVGINGFQIACDGRYKVEEFPGSHLTGKINIMVNQVDVMMDLNFEKSDLYPTSLSVDECNIENIDITIRLSGVNVDTIATQVEKYIKTMLHYKICEEFASNISVSATNAFSNMAPYLHAVVNQGPDTVPGFGDDTLDWRDSELSEIHEKIQELAREWNITHPIINDIVNGLTNGTGAFDIPMNSTIHSVNFHEINVTAAEYNFGVKGLNSFKNIKVLEPSTLSKVVLTTSWGLKQLVLLHNITLSYQNPDNEVFTHDIAWEVIIEEINVEMDLILALNKTFLEHLDRKMININCIAHSIQEIQASSLVVDVDLSTVHFVQKTSGGAMEDSLMALVDNNLSLLTQGFGDLMTAYIKGMAQGQVRSHINYYLTELYMMAMSMPCPPN